MRLSRGSLIVLVQWLSLAAAAGFVFYSAVLPQLFLHHPRSFLMGAFRLTAMAWAWSALIGLLLWFVARPGDPKTAIRRTSAAVVWFAPATILASQLMPVTVFPAAALAAATARMLFVEWRKAPRYAKPQSAVPAMVIALVAQSAVVAFLTNHDLSGSALAIMALATLTVYSLETGAAEARSGPGLPRSAAGVILTLVLAFGLTVGGSWGVVAGHWWERFRGVATKPAPAQTAAAPVPPFPSMGGDFLGVILQSETQATSRLVEPRPYFGPGRLAPVDRRPLSILFDGHYDIFRWPYRQAPPASFTRKGSPLEFGFHTADQMPLQMEARQRLDVPLDVSCCRSIELHIWNADTTVGRIWLELVLMDRGAAVSLGRVPVKSQPRVGEKAGEMLEFPMPASLPLDEADELKIVFSRTMARLDHSFRISI